MNDKMKWMTLIKRTEKMRNAAHQSHTHRAMKNSHILNISNQKKNQKPEKSYSYTLHTRPVAAAFEWAPWVCLR